MLRKHRSFIVFTLACLALGAVFGGIWTAATGEYQPPLWVTAAAAIGTGLFAGALEAALDRHLNRRDHRKTDTAPTTGLKKTGENA